MTLPELERLLATRLGEPLPGIAAQARMAPRPRPGWSPGTFRPDARHGGALLLFYPVRRQPHLLLTLRDRALARHGGQVSLPGGAVDPGESYDAAALREAHEEVGVDPRRVRIVGPLTPVEIPVSGFVLHPRVGVARRRPDLRPDRREVARVLEVPLSELQDPRRLAVERRERGGRSAEVPFFALDGEQVWGATAMVLSELLCVLGTPPDPW